MTDPIPYPGDPEPAGEQPPAARYGTGAADPGADARDDAMPEDTAPEKGLPDDAAPDDAMPEKDVRAEAAPDEGAPSSGASGGTDTGGASEARPAPKGRPGVPPAEDAPADGTSEEPSLRAGLEAILMVVDEPVPEVTLAQILERPREEVAAALCGLAAEYTEQGRGFELRKVAGGWRLYTREVCAPLVERFVLDGQQARLTQAALETLAVVAYRQPVSRARVSAIRGVNSDGVIRTLTLRGLIEEAGHDPEHQAVLYRTTSYFLERLGLNSLDELPDLAPYLPDDVEGIEELQQ